jgi:hypothetical protein
MVTRRTLLRRTSALAAVGSVGVLAGCNGGSGSGTGTGTADDSPVPQYAQRLYDPTMVLDAQLHGFVSYDLATVYSSRDIFPSAAVSQVEEFDSRNDLVDVSALDRLTGQVYAGATPAELAGGTTGSTAAGGTAVVTGSFDPDGIADTLRQASGEGTTVEERGSAAGHTLYAVAGSGSPATVALSEDSLGLGATTAAAGATGSDAIRTALTADGGYDDSDGTVRTLIDVLGNGAATSGFVGEFGAAMEGQLPDEPALRAAATGLGGLGSSVTLSGGEMTSTVAGVYAEGEVPTEDDLRALAEWLAARAAETDRASLSAEEIQTAVDGRAVTLSIRQDPEAVFDFGDRAVPLPGGPELLVLSLFPAIVAVFGILE